MSEELLEAARKKFGQAEVYRVESESHPVSFESNRLKEIMRRETSGVALRVINGGRIGFSSTTNPEKQAELVDRVRTLSEFGSEAMFQFPAGNGYPAVEAVDSAVGQTSEAEMIETGEMIIDRLRSDWPDLLCDVRVGKSVGRVRVQNSSGVDCEFEQTGYYVYAGGELIRGTDMLSVWSGHASAGKFGPERVDVIVGDVLRALEYSREIAPAPSGKGDVPVIFTPRGVMATLAGPLLSGFNGRNVATGSSPLIDRWGEKMVDERISVVDNPLEPMAANSRPFDGEGVPARKVSLIENGVIGEALFDLQTAGQAGRATTGSAHRGLASTPSPGSTLIEVAPGDTPYEELFEGIEKGLVVEGLLGAGQGNELGGDFRANVALGYRIENGEIVGRVKDTLISGNVYEVLNSIEAVSSESQWVFGSSRTPAIRCTGVEVAAQG